MAVSFHCRVGTIARDRTAADERADKRRKRFRTLRRDRVPGAQIGIVHALLRILRACKDVVRELVAELAVFLVQLADGILRARKEQLDDLRVFHRAAPPFLVKKCFYLNRRNFRQDASRNRKIFLFFLFDVKNRGFVPARREKKGRYRQNYIINIRKRPRTFSVRGR